MATTSVIVQGRGSALWAWPSTYRPSAKAIRWPVPLLLIQPPESFQVEAIPVIELDAFLFQQAPLEGVTAIAG